MILRFCSCIVLAVAVLLFGGQARAEDAPSNTPVNITADALEFHDQDKTYIARGHAVVVQNGVTISADLLTAKYVEDNAGKTNVTQVLAEGHVAIKSGDHTVEGQRGLYDVARKVVVLKGDNLRFTSGADVVTAQDSLEYWEVERLAVARGNAVATREDRKVAADILTAAMETGADNKQEIRRLGAEGHVLISSPTEIVQGNRGVYDLKRQLATLDGNVRITRGQNQLNGARAEVNMATGVSRLLAASGQRVRGLIVPKDAPQLP